jgi:S1-C subfamily serine protease
VEAPPDATPRQLAPRVVREVPAARNITRVTIPRLSRDGFERRARQITVRVRNVTCEGVGTGSGFAVDPTTLITNRHVVAGAEVLEINTADGQTLQVSAAAVGVLGDVAFVSVDGRLPVSARLDGRAPAGAQIVAVGYPLGGPLTLSPGTVVDRIAGHDFNVPGPIIRTNAEIQPGNSGGPLLDPRGHVAGVVYAIEVATGLGLAIPIGTMRTLLDEAGTTSVPPCGSE